MSDDDRLDEHLRRAAERSLQARASDVDIDQAIDEHRARLASPRSSSRRGRRVLAAAAAVIVVAAGVAAIASPRSAGAPDLVATETVDPPPLPTPTEATTATGAPMVEATTIASTNSVSTPPSSDVAEDPADEVTLEMIGKRRAEALAGLDGFTATHTIEMTRGSSRSPRVEVQEITALADGRIWTEDEQGSWTSTDPATGLFRAKYVQDGGTATYQQLTDRTGFALGRLSMALKAGDDPAAPIDIVDGAGASIEHTTLDGRSTWTVFARDESEEFDTQSEQTWVVDIETGLIVEYVFSKWEEGQDGDENRFRSTLTDLRPAAELPDDFPRPFPPDVDVQSEFDLSDGHRLFTLDQAAAEFSPGLVVPADLTDNAIVTIYDRALDNPGSNRHPDSEEVRMITRRGFDISTVTVTKFIPIDGLTLTVGDVQCYDLDQNGRCDPFGVADTVERGALSGRELWIAGRYVTIADAGRTIEIADPDVARARALADTFVTL